MYRNRMWWWLVSSSSVRGPLLAAVDTIRTGVFHMWRGSSVLSRRISVPQWLHDRTVMSPKVRPDAFPTPTHYHLSDTSSVKLIWWIVSRFLSMCCSRLIHHPVPKYPYIIIRQKGRTVHKRFSGVKIYLCPDFIA